MSKNYNYKNYTNISEAMNHHNKVMPGEKFTLLDYNLLCLAKSFHDSETDLYMSNENLAEMFFASEKTVRTSINRLCAAGLLKKENVSHKTRNLVYSKEGVQKFISKMTVISSKK